MITKHATPVPLPPSQAWGAVLVPGPSQSGNDDQVAMRCAVIGVEERERVHAKRDGGRGGEPEMRILVDMHANSEELRKGPSPIGSWVRNFFRSTT
ncbi:hypothetical protein SISSUDRAFT_1050271 [Sistotremastrum suecicum HHB10207 ss-3]|uniref:Uncharacterized protein n=1 Tax=Sistotremastrum suecicum HHB10207 ss-3 TaxID=1314776 RepID=A0A166BA91_9AGAM|nr:hypothetical protein SISSUDRAFT_1050271 [Sistotremastrum suecicum HHB10207 ss-3]